MNAPNSLLHKCLGVAPPLRLLVSVRNLDEARAVAAQGVEFIDLKDPDQGALGGLPLHDIALIVKALRAGPWQRLSATVGDLDAADIPAVLDQVAAVAACGVDDVKVGVPPGAQGLALLKALAGAAQAMGAIGRVKPKLAAQGLVGPAVPSVMSDAVPPAASTTAPRVVPVLLADDGVPWALLAEALALRCFEVLMLDTQDKTGGGLLQRCRAQDLQRFVAQAREAGVLAGLAGSLRLSELPTLRALAPGFAGFRTAVCQAGRRSALDPVALRQLVNASVRDSLVTAQA